ncbi:hypothetical protein EMIHUDRAFT_219271 [Emiliania huxleyi CCMP1516]|uniref:Uncharacterized protein n=2 Tax=Emiliania huxleyi TaxID=2903 RepID=A0A0D3I554_EMIH1|nr:hypothetical protein EMIHUDRAFT_219271 [Emiliania huxleyi CCMP1516]EOD06389.1 hypothetical protein EMIHUDRAFT_219271 [Emiliania huxleyi CCMP1516]|eukprot:XP_005758818.1 hypothetical protein EMIHUDRAFT_219271 [Emiliania huxleyi CCMP1516]
MERPRTKRAMALMDLDTADGKCAGTRLERVLTRVKLGATADSCDDAEVQVSVARQRTAATLYYAAAATLNRCEPALQERCAQEISCAIGVFAKSYPTHCADVQDLLAVENLVGLLAQGDSRGCAKLREVPCVDTVFALAVGCTVAEFCPIADALLSTLVRNHGADALNVGATASALAFLAGGGPDGTSLDDSGALVAAGFLLDLGAGPDDVACLLLAAAADPNVKTSRMPPLHLAAHSDSVEIVESLAAHGANLDHKEPTWNGETALHLACRRGHFDVATALVALGASTKIKSFSSMTPMQTARAFKHDDLAAWLKASSEAGPKGKGGKGGKKARHAQKLAPAERHEQRLQEEAAAEQAADEAQQQRDVGEAAGMKAALHAAGEKATMVALPSMVDYAKLSVSTEPHAGTTLFFNVCLKTPPSDKVLIAFRRDVARWLLAAHEAYCTFSQNLGVHLPPEPSRGEIFAARSIKEAPTFHGRMKLRSGVFPHDWLC